MELEAQIAAIRQETPSVKSFVLDLQGQQMPFVPGQYIDLVIETDYDSLIGGFSITSSPLRKDSLELAVEFRPDRPMAAYLHDKAQVGDEVLVLGASGEFVYRPEMGNSLVLIAGGIGITPFVSMVRFVDEAQLDTRVSLLYSARTPADLVFLDELRSIATRNPRIDCLFTVTRPT
ncbi:MAG: FAD-dependent oxidoreductase, partial [Dehalococcoidia bacterium]|nr:FAD-dependent oxidoreductase [Dehalococcoidia bacterium]